MQSSIEAKRRGWVGNDIMVGLIPDLGLER